MSRVPFPPAVFASFFLIASVASAQTPKLTVNGVTSVNNSATPHLRALGSLNIQITGTPNAPFALLLSEEAYDGVPGGEPNQTTGFFLKRWQPNGSINSPILPVFDGIGTGLIASKLPQSPANPSWSAADFLSDTASGFFNLGPTGTFSVTGVVPTAAYLFNTLNPNNPTLISLESAVIPSNVFLFLQVVELDPQTQALHVGNGMKVFFDKITFPGTVAYSEGQDATQTSLTLGSKQSPGVIVDTDLNAAPLGTFTAAPDFSAFGNNVDFWMITLAGVQPLIPTSWIVNGPGGTGAAPTEPDTNYAAVWNYASSLEFLNAGSLARNNENREFPWLRLPGGRYLFHWRNGSVGNPTYGFGIYFEATGQFRNLVPPAFGSFTETAILSPWEVEVGVTPDGSRAMVVLDQNSVSTANDRIFLLNLDPGGNFSNGFPIIERTPSPTTEARRVWEESITFAKDGAGGWVGYILTSNVSGAGVATYPNRIYRVNMDGNSTPSQAAPTTGDSQNVTNFDRQPMLSPDQLKICVVGRSGAATNESLFVIRNITTSTQQVQNISKGASKQLAEWTDVTDGQTGVGAFSPDSTLFAFARATPSQFIPNVAVTDASGPASVDLIAEITNGGQFAITGDFPSGRDYQFTPDNKFVLFSQGSLGTGPSADRMDLFAVEIATKHSVNLTRTMLTATYDGPWDPIITTQPPIDQRPTIDAGGQFVSNDGDTLFYFRDARATPNVAFDRYDLIAIDIGTPSQGAHQFLVTNVFGTEFAPLPNLSPPATGAPFLYGSGTFLLENQADYYQPRRIGGTGPLKDYYYMIGRLAGLPGGDPRLDTDQLFLFDGANPGPALQLTNYGTNSSPLACAFSSRIRNIIPSQTQNRVAFILDNGGTPTAGAGLNQELVVLDLDNFGTQIRVPSTAGVFTQCIAAGSTHWLPTSPEGLVYAAGTVQRGANAIVDGTSDSNPDPFNPIDTTAYFYRFATGISPETNTAIAAAPTGNPVNRRLAHVFTVKTP